MNYVELEKVLTEIIFKKDERTPLYITLPRLLNDEKRILV